MQESHKLQPILGFGAGGHCKVIIEVIHCIGAWKVVGLLNDNEVRINEVVGGVPIIGNDSLAITLLKNGVTSAFIGIGSIGSSHLRRKIYSFVCELGFKTPTLIHPSSLVSFDTIIEAATCVMPGAIINSGTSIGQCCIINSGSIIEHDCNISNFVHVAPGAILAGNVHIGEGSHIGIGAVVRQGIQIGKNSVIGAGAVVVKDVKDDTVVTGVPASIYNSKK